HRDEGHFWGDFALAIFRRLGELDGMQGGRALSNLGAILFEEGKPEEALKLHQHAVELMQKIDPDSPRVAMTLSNLANDYGRLGRWDEAIAIDRRQLAIREKSQGPAHPDIAWALQGLGDLLNQQ